MRQSIAFDLASASFVFIKSSLNYIMGMLTACGSLSLDRIHNSLKMFCTSDPTYDKSLQQLYSFLSGLVSEEKLELRDGLYMRKK
ncbi:hypothetical protein GIB67_011957 [Kingdonia uniflora]|uniref:Anaphase-promoting complex subunit 2 n=1 Tax=Kingdonia uniflora TaxID=39325 RepID=A0A7J7M020_9MAGN|nr:hypothetical protein GIB67_011957 [Kingdonia uniflora]